MQFGREFSRLSGPFEVSSRDSPRSIHAHKHFTNLHANRALGNFSENDKAT